MFIRPRRNSNVNEATTILTVIRKQKLLLSIKLIQNYEQKEQVQFVKRANVTI